MYKLKEGFILRQIAGENIIIPSGQDLDLNMMITVNETGCFLWEKLQEGAEEKELVDAVLEEYDTDREHAESAVRTFITKLKEHEFLV